MASIGTGYDLAASTYSPDGRLLQVEYAQKAVDSACTAIAIKCTDGVVFAVEKLRPTRLLRPGSNRQIERTGLQTAVLGCGLPADCRHLWLRAREEVSELKKTTGEEPQSVQLAERLALYVQQHTLYSSVRPFGAAMIVGGVNGGSTGLYMVEPSGKVHGYRAIAIGRARQHARTELEKLLADSSNAGQQQLMTCEQAIKHAIRILVISRQEDPSARERQVELEVAALTTDHKFQCVPLPQVQSMAKQALDNLNAAMDFEEI